MRDSRGPPSAPEMTRRLNFGRFQAVGALIVVAIPIMALAGLFGETWGRTSKANGELAVNVSYPERFRYKQINQIVVTVENLGTEPVDTVAVDFDAGYVLQFSSPLFIPSAVESFRVPITDLDPGASALVLLKIQGEEYGRHTGEIRVTTSRGDSISLTVSTFIFP